MKKLFCAGLVLVCLAVTSFSNPDPDFGTNGVAIFDFFNEPTQPDSVTTIESDSSGRVVLGAVRNVGENVTRGTLARLNEDGTLDKSFNGTGVVDVAVSSSTTNDIADVELQHDGKILVVGSYQNAPDLGYYIYRFNEDGTPDKSFGNKGEVRVGLLGGGAVGRAIRVLDDGKILVAGATASIITQTLRFAVFRRNTDGSRDSGFGSNGTASVAFSNSNDVAVNMTLQSDGKIIAAGGSNLDLGGSDGSLAIARLTEGGQIDSSFNGDGTISINLGDLIDTASDVEVQADGKIVVSGASCADANCSSGGGFLFRFLTSGLPDGDFAENGRLFLDDLFPDDSTALAGVEVDEGGKLIIAGAKISITDGGDGFVARVNDDGTFDSEFGTDGAVIADNDNNGDLILGLTIQNDGKYLVGGSTAGSTDTLASVWRFLPDSSSDTRFDFTGDGKADISVFRRSLGEWWFLRSEDNQDGAFAFGSPTDVAVPADFTGDGIADFSFWRPDTGEWFVLRSDHTGFFSFPFGATGDVPAPGDFDGDGADDAAVYRPSSGTWFILNSSDGQTQFIPFGASVDRPLVGDYDGDGTDDVAIYKPDVAQFWQLRSTEGLQAFAFGAVGDIAIAADFSGDGTDDMVLFRPTTGFWNVLRSEDSNFFGFPFGAAGDIPAPGDYDGDGTADATVFRPSDTTWYSQQSTNGAVFTPFGIAGDEPVPGAYNSQ